MEPLPLSLRIGGFDMQQIHRNGMMAVYSQSKGGKIVSYELIRIQVAKAATIMGRSYPERESYPGNEMWGQEAWTVVDRAEAIQRAETLSK